jgi:Leu/Phe-tRNA-protein transferase
MHISNVLKALFFNPKFLLIAIDFSIFPSLIDLSVNLIKCQVRTETANTFGALTCGLSSHLPTICQMPLKHWKYACA